MPTPAHDCVVLPERPAALEYVDGAQSSLLIVSSYEQLDDPTSTNGGQRQGSVFLIDERGNVDRVRMSGGVFRFALRPQREQLVAALSSGSLCTLGLHCKRANDFRVVEDALLLSVDLSGDRALTSDSRGRIHVVDLLTGVMLLSLNAHWLPYTGEACEVWSAAWSDDGATIASGGDDGVLKLWDARCSQKPTQTNRSSHGSGVVCITNETDHRFLTGSYDEYIRRFDARKICEPVCEQKLNGGVWSMQRAGPSSLVVACMYGGWALVARDTLNLLHSNSSYGDFLLYGASASLFSQTVATCTFNDFRVRFDKIAL